MVAVLGANLLTAMFFWGMSRAFKIKDLEGDRLDMGTACAIIVPIFFFGGGVWLYS